MSKAILMFTGDILCYPEMTDGTNEDYSRLFREIERPSDCDFLVGNLETPVAGKELLYTHELYCFNTPDSFVGTLKNFGFDLVSLANNHCMDRNEQGIERTLENCRKYGMDTVGLYTSPEDRNQIYIREINGIKVAFISYTYGTNAFAHRLFLKRPYMVNLLQPEETLKGSIHLLESAEDIAARVDEIYGKKGEEYQLAKPYLEQLQNDIKCAKESADYVVMLLHCGGQYNPLPDAYTKYVARQIKEYGADIIVGLHPHIIQPCDTSDGYMTAYCLGNLICPEDKCLPSEVDPSYSAVLRLALEKDESGKITAKTGFSLYKTVTEDGLPIIYDTYDLCSACGDEKLIKDCIHYANLFAGDEKYSEIQKVYTI